MSDTPMLLFLTNGWDVTPARGINPLNLEKQLLKNYSRFHKFSDSLRKSKWGCMRPRKTKTIPCKRLQTKKFLHLKTNVQLNRQAKSSLTIEKKKVLISNNKKAILSVDTGLGSEDQLKSSTKNDV